MSRRLHGPNPILGRAAMRMNRSLPAWRGASAIIVDSGDDHEMAEEFGNSLARAGDRLVGFVVGAGLFAIAWALWTIV